MEKYFITQGIDVLCVDVNADNIPSINLLEKSGYQKYASGFMILKSKRDVLRIHSYQKIIKRKIA